MGRTVHCERAPRSVPALARIGSHPGKEPESIAPPGGRRNTENQPSLRILVADDSPVNRKVIEAMLAKYGHSLTLVQNGREALEALDRAPFELVLMDVQMPEMDGLQATAAIRARDAALGVHTPIIAITAHAMMGDRERYLAAGMDAYVSKPIRSEQLMEAITQALSRSVQRG